MGVLSVTRASRRLNRSRQVKMSAPVDENREVVSHLKKKPQTHLPEDSV